MPGKISSRDQENVKSQYNVCRGDLPLHDAAASGRRELVTWLLNMRPSQVNARNNDGRTPLHMAALNDNVDMCKVSKFFSQNDL